MADLKKDILAGCEKYLEPGKDIQFGYGHGKRGKQIAIVLDSDSQEVRIVILLYIKHI